MKNNLLNITSLVICFIVIPVFLFWIGYSQIYPQFSGEWTQHLGSIEVSYITMAKFIQASWPNFAWQPLWYFGYPMHVLYTPLVPFFEYLAHNTVGWSYSHAYRFLTAFSYCASLVSLYFFVKILLKSKSAGLIAALSYTILPSIIALLYPEVANDSFLPDLIDPRRFTILVRWGEGPHTVSLMFLPLAALFLYLFLRKSHAWKLVVGAFFTVLVLLTNSVGAWGLFILSFCLVFGELVEYPKKWARIIVKAGVFASLSFGLVAFWFNPLFLSTFFSEGGGALGFWRNQFPWGWIIVAVLGIGFFMLSRKFLRKIPGATSVVLFFLMMFALVNTYYASGEERVELVPQVLRLNTEVDIGFAFMLALVPAALKLILAKKIPKLKYVYTIVALIVALGLLYRQTLLIAHLPEYAQPLETTGHKLTDSAEYEVATLLADAVEPGERVLVPGNYAFYLNYFYDVPQLRGALFQSKVHPWPEHIYYQITNGNDGEISRDWLKISNVGWMVYGGSRETFHDFRVPARKFAEVLDKTDEINEEQYFRVPLVSTSLAKVVPKALADVETPRNAIEAEPIHEYVNLLEQGRGLDFQEIANGRYEITGKVDENELILVQNSYVSGWHAFDIHAQGLEVDKDGLGFITIKPKEAGEQKITLYYTTPLSVWMGRLVTLVSIIISIILLTPLRKRLVKLENKAIAEIKPKNT
ncbi:hypothetical protein C4579_02585 [Candidatus Microgenomates bacterium]|nr:MAG: hypothetical protein C4579_02585 [Candidatus Microgenomates bacterium]